MKIRQGFVSNSSSSSFILTTTDTELMVNEILDKFLVFYNDLYNTELELNDVVYTDTNNKNQITIDCKSETPILMEYFIQSHWNAYDNYY